jgi:hypothetical protein
MKRRVRVLVCLAGSAGADVPWFTSSAIATIQTPTPSA